MVMAWFVTTWGLGHDVVSRKRHAAFLGRGSVGLAEMYQPQFDDGSRGQQNCAISNVPLAAQDQAPRRSAIIDREVVPYSPFSFVSNVGTQLWDGLRYPNWRGWPAADDPTCWLGPLMVDGGTCCGAPPACGSALASSLAFTPSGPAIT
jgi:hypothetical protein